MGGNRTVTIIIAMVVFAGLVVIGLRAGKPVPATNSTNSQGQSFEVRVVKPLLARPLAGLFGLLPAEDLGFDHASRDAEVGRVRQDLLELVAEDWDLIIETDSEGQITQGTRLVFTMELGGKVRKLCCRPADPAVGYLNTTKRAGSEELGGRFLVELAKREIAETGKSIAWPPAPLKVRGSFNRLPIAPAEPAVGQ